MAVVSTGQFTITDTNDGISILLSNHAHAAPSNDLGAGVNLTGAFTTVTVNAGGRDVTADWTLQATPTAGLTGTFSNGTYTVTGLTVDVAAVDFTATKAGSATLTARFTVSKAKAGTGGLTLVLSNESHNLPASTAGVVSTYSGSGTTVEVFEGTIPLSAVGTIKANGQFTIGTPTLAPGSAITVGGRSYATTKATIAAHSAMSNSVDSVTITYPISVRTRDGSNYTLYRVQTLSKSKQGATGDTGPQGVQGPVGQTTYTWIKYATSATGAGISNSPTGMTYIGLAYNKTTATESNVATDYTWSLIQGEKGDTGVQGPTGPQGQATYTWIKYSANADGTGLTDTPNSSTAYIGIAPNKTTATESTDKTQYTWSLFKGATGDTGPQGVPGPQGQATYTWIKYATSATGAGINNSPTGMTYIGLAYNKTTATESNTPSDYTWSLIKGEKGDTGVQGPTGPQGQATYTWIKYSANADGTGLTDTPQANTAYIGIAPNKTTAAESTDKTQYVWSLFKGATGATGATGPTGPKGSTGATGKRGTNHTYVLRTTATWSNSEANSSLPGGPIVADRVTQYYPAGQWAETRYYTGSAWALLEEVIDGNLLVTKSVTADSINLNSLYSQNANITGSLRVGNETNYVQLGGDAFIRAQAGSDTLFLVPTSGKGLLQGNGLVPGSVLADALSSDAIGRIRQELGGLLPEYGGSQSISETLESKTYALNNINSNSTPVELTFYYLGSTHQVTKTNQPTKPPVPTVTVNMRRGTTSIKSQVHTGEVTEGVDYFNNPVWKITLPSIQQTHTDASPGSGALSYSVIVTIANYSPLYYVAKFNYTAIQEASGAEGTVKWANVQDKPVFATRWPTAAETASLSLSGGSMTGAINFNAGAVQAANSIALQLNGVSIWRHGREANGDYRMWYYNDAGAYVGAFGFTRSGQFSAGSFSGNGAGLTNVDASLLNGFSSSASDTANTIARRDGSGDVHARLFRSDYANQSTISGAIAYRASTTDNYIRFCSDMVAFREFIQSPRTTTSASIGTDHSESAIAYSQNPLMGAPDGAMYQHVYSSSWKHQIQGDYRTGQLSARGKNNGVWQSWRAILDSENFNQHALSLTGGSLTGELVVKGVGLNSAPSVDDIRLSGYGMMGRRGSLYITNTAGEVQIGNGTSHNANAAASFNTVSVNLGTNRELRMNNTTVIDAARNIKNVGTIDADTINVQRSGVGNYFKLYHLIPNPGSDFGAGRTFLRFLSNATAAIFMGGRLRIGGTFSWAPVMGVLEIEFGAYVAKNSTTVNNGSYRITAATGAAALNLRFGPIEVVAGFIGCYVYSLNSNSIEVMFDGYCNGAPITNLSNTPWETTTLPEQQTVQFFGAEVTGGLKLSEAWSGSNLSGNALFVSDNNRGFAFGNGATLSSWFSYNGTLRRGIDVYNDGSRIDLFTGNSVKATLNGTGLGLGTSSPIAPLHILNGSSGQSPSNNVGLLIESNGTSNVYYPLQVATSGGGTSFSVTNAGNVGVGTKTPAKKLHMVGDALRVETSTGYIDIGSQNSSWAHFTTDRSKFYFGSPIEAYTELRVYGSTHGINASGHFGNGSALSDVGAVSISYKPLSNGNLDTAATAGLLEYFEGSGMAGAPNTNWHSVISVRHNNSSNKNGFQMAYQFATDSFSVRGTTGSSYRSWLRMYTDAYHPEADKWTTARSLTIGNKSRSVDGTSNVSWSHEDIGALRWLTVGVVNVNAANLTGLYAGSTGSWSNRGPSGNNAGALLNINTHSGNYYSQMWFDTDNNALYHRASNGALPTGTWNRIYEDNYHPIADRLTTPRLINRKTFNGSTDIETTEWFHSGRDFTLGTLVTTSIDYSATNGNPWVLEVTGNAYGPVESFDLKAHGYIYSNTIVNIGGHINGFNMTGIVAMNVGGKLCFWWPRYTYWQGFNVRVYTALATQGENQVVSIANSADPVGTKRVTISDKLRAQPVDKGMLSTVGGGNKVAQYAANGYLYVNSWIQSANGTGLFYPNGTHFYSNGTGNLRMFSTSSNATFNMSAGGDTVRGSIHATTSNEIGFLDQAGSWTLRTVGGYTYFGSGSGSALYDAAGRLSVRAESANNVANFASYGMYLPVKNVTAGLYVESAIEARGGIRMGAGGAGANITGSATFTDTATFNLRTTIKDVLEINTSGPAINLRDLDGTSAFVHVNSNYFYILRANANSTTWTQTGNGWPLQLDLETNHARFGGDITLNGTVARGNLGVSTNSASAIDCSIHLGYAAADFYGFKIVNSSKASSFSAGTLRIQRGTTSAWIDALTMANTGQITVASSVTADTFYTSSWYRTYGSTGWFSETYGGGIHMTDSTWVRVYNGKQFYVSNAASDAIYTAGGVKALGNITSNGMIYGYRNTAAGHNYANGNLELRTTNGSSPSMGFHRSGYTACQLRHDSNGLILSSTSQSGAADFRALGSIISDYGFRTVANAGSWISGHRTDTVGGLDITTVGNTSSYFRWISQRTPSGGWSMGTLNNSVYFNFATSTNINANSNSVLHTLRLNSDQSVTVWDRIYDWGGVKYMKWSDFEPSMFLTQEFMDANNLNFTQMDALKASFISAGVLGANLIATSGLNVVSAQNDPVKRKFTLYPGMSNSGIGQGKMFHFRTVDASGNDLEDLFYIDTQGEGYFKGSLARGNVDSKAISEDAKKAMNPYYLGDADSATWSGVQIINSGQVTAATLAIGNGNQTPVKPTERVSVTFDVEANVHENQMTPFSSSWGNSTYVMKLQMRIGAGSWTDVAGQSVTYTVTAYNYNPFGGQGPSERPDPYTRGYSYKKRFQFIDSGAGRTSDSVNVQYRIFVSRTATGAGTSGGMRFVRVDVEKDAFIKNELTTTTSGVLFVDKDTGYATYSGKVTRSGAGTVSVPFPRQFQQVYSCTLGYDRSGGEAGHRFPPRYENLWEGAVTIRVVDGDTSRTNTVSFHIVGKMAT